MKLSNGWHLAYCTNIHRGESWAEIFGALKTHTLTVREQVGRGRPYAIGLRLGDQAARELSDRAVRLNFQRWLERENCYVFTINGFPFGRFHGTRVKEHVYQPDWATPERLEYTQRLFDLLAELVPAGGEGSVSTLPICFKAAVQGEAHLAAARANLWRCVEHIAALSRRSGRALHLGLEPEPLCFLETTEEAVRFFEALRRDRPGDERIHAHLGLNYDCCHLALEFEDAAEALGRLHDAGIKLSKVHLSNALKVQPSPAARQALGDFVEGVYLHQVVARTAGGQLARLADLPQALADERADDREWRIHFHVPLHAEPAGCFGNTADHLLGVLDYLAQHPQTCRHFEMETYTWEVLPGALRQTAVTDQLVREYGWMFRELELRGIGRE